MKLFILKVISLIKDVNVIREKLKRLGRLTPPRNTIDPKKYTYKNLMVPVSNLQFRDDFKDLRNSDREKLKEAKVDSYSLDIQINDPNEKNFALDVLFKGLDRNYLHLYGIKAPHKQIQVMHLTGEGGSGKTTLIYKLYLDFIKNPHPQYEFIFIDLSVVDSANHASDFEGHALQKEVYMKTLRDRVNEIHALGKKPILLVEGLDVPLRVQNDKDETVNRDHKRKIINDLYHLMNDSDLTDEGIDLKMICVGRPDDGGVMKNSDAYNQNGYVHLTLKPFDSAQMEQALRKYIDACYDKENFEPGEVEKLVELLMSKTEIVDIIQNPSHLSMLFALDIDELKNINNITVHKLYEKFWANRVLNEGKDYAFENLPDIKITPQERADFAMKMAYAKIRGLNVRNIFPQDKESQQRLRWVEESLSNDRVYNPETDTFFHDSFMVYAAGLMLKKIVDDNLSDYQFLFYDEGIKDNEKRLFLELYEDVCFNEGKSVNLELMKVFLNTLPAQKQSSYIHYLLSSRKPYREEIVFNFCFGMDSPKIFDQTYKIILHYINRNAYIHYGFSVKKYNMARFVEHITRTKFDAKLFEYFDVNNFFKLIHDDSLDLSVASFESALFELIKLVNEIKSLEQNEKTPDTDKLEVLMNTLFNSSNFYSGEKQFTEIMKKILFEKSIFRFLKDRLTTQKQNILSEFLELIFPTIRYEKTFSKELFMRLVYRHDQNTISKNAINKFRTEAYYHFFADEVFLSSSVEEQLKHLESKVENGTFTSLDLYYLLFLRSSGRLDEQKLNLFFLSNLTKIFSGKFTDFNFGSALIGDMHELIKNINTNLDDEIMRVLIEADLRNDLADIRSRLVAVYINNIFYQENFDGVFKLAHKFENNKIDPLKDNFLFLIRSLENQKIKMSISDTEKIFDLFENKYFSSQHELMDEDEEEESAVSNKKHAAFKFNDIAFMFNSLFGSNVVNIDELQNSLSEIILSILNSNNTKSFYDDLKLRFYLTILFEMSDFKNEGYGLFLKLFENSENLTENIFDSLYYYPSWENLVEQSTEDECLRLFHLIAKFFRKNEVRWLEFGPLGFLEGKISYKDIRTLYEDIPTISQFKQKIYLKQLFDDINVDLSVLSSEQKNRALTYFNSKFEKRYVEDNEKLTIFAQNNMRGHVLVEFSKEYGLYAVFRFVRKSGDLSKEYISEIFEFTKSIPDADAVYREMICEALLTEIYQNRFDVFYSPREIEDIFMKYFSNYKGEEDIRRKQFSGQVFYRFIKNRHDWAVKNFSISARRYRYLLYRKINNDGYMADTYRLASELKATYAFLPNSKFDLNDSNKWLHDDDNFSLRLYSEFMNAKTKVKGEFSDQGLIDRLIKDYQFIRPDGFDEPRNSDVLKKLIENVKDDPDAYKFFLELEREVTAQSEKAIPDLIKNPTWKKLENVIGRFDKYSQSGKDQIAMYLSGIVSDIISELNFDHKATQKIVQFVLKNHMNNMVKSHEDAIKNMDLIKLGDPAINATLEKRAPVAFRFYQAFLNLDRQYAEKFKGHYEELDVETVANLIMRDLLKEIVLRNDETDTNQRRMEFLNIKEEIKKMSHEIKDQRYKKMMDKFNGRLEILDYEALWMKPSKYRQKHYFEDKKSVLIENKDPTNGFAEVIEIFNPHDLQNEKNAHVRSSMMLELFDLFDSGAKEVIDESRQKEIFIPFTVDDLYGHFKTSDEMIMFRDQNAQGQFELKGMGAYRKLDKKLSVDGEVLPTFYISGVIAPEYGNQVFSAIVCRIAEQLKGKPFIITYFTQNQQVIDINKNVNPGSFKEYIRSDYHLRKLNLSNRFDQDGKKSNEEIISLLKEIKIRTEGDVLNDEDGIAHGMYFYGHKGTNNHKRIEGLGQFDAIFLMNRLSADDFSEEKYLIDQSGKGIDRFKSKFFSYLQTYQTLSKLP